jgi:recombination protein RecA
MAADNMVKDGKENVGNLVKVKVIKNKVAPPFKNCEFNVIWGLGIDKVDEIINIGNEREVLKKWGKTITYNDTKYDVLEFAQLLNDNEDFKNEILNKIKNG